MRFGFFTLILMIGVFGSILSNGLPHSSSHSEKVRQVADSTEREHERSEPQSTNPMDGTVELDREADGHFYADVQVNGATLHMLVDTGATIIALSREDARSAGLATSI